MRGYRTGEDEGGLRLPPLPPSRESLESVFTSIRPSKNSLSGTGTQYEENMTESHGLRLLLYIELTCY